MTGYAGEYEQPMLDLFVAGFSRKWGRPPTEQEVADRVPPPLPRREAKRKRKVRSEWNTPRARSGPAPERVISRNDPFALYPYRCACGVSVTLYGDEPLPRGWTVRGAGRTWRYVCPACSHGRLVPAGR